MDFDECYRLATEHSNEGVIIVSGDKRLFVNQKCLELAGYRTFQEFDKIPFLSTVHPDDRERIKEIMRKRQMGEPAPSVYEFRFLRPDGSTVDIEISSCSVTYMGKPASLGYFRDISDRKQTEEKLHQSEEKYRNILENIQEGYFEIDLVGNFTFVNNAECRNLGYLREELIGMNNRQYQDEATVRKMYQIFNNIYKTGEPVKASDIEIIKKDGTKKFNEVSVSLIRDAKGKPIGFRGISRDITERKQAEEIVLRSEKRFKTLYQESPIPIFTWQKNGDDFFLIDFNRAAILLTEGKTSKYMGKSAQEMYRKRPEIIDDMIRCFKEQSIISRELVSKDFAPGRILSTYYSHIPPDLIIVQTEDITEHKRAEEKLRRSEENFRLSLDDSPLGIRIVTAEGETLYANRAILDIYGYDSLEELRVIPLKKRYTPESYAEFNIRKEKRERGEFGPSEYEISIVRKNGEVRHVQVFRKEIFWNGARQFQVIYQDITEHKRAEEALTNSEAKLRKEQNFSQLLLDTSSALIVAIDFDGETLMMNRALLDTLEYTAEEIKGTDYLTTFVPEEDRGMLSDVFQKIIQKKIATVNENWIISKSGRTYLVEWHGRTVSNEEGGVDFFVGVGIDITERKQAEEKLRRSEEKHRKILENMEEGYFELDLAGNYTFVNDAECRNIGYSREELIGMNNRQFQDEETVKKMYLLFNTLYKTGEPIKVLDVEIIGKDGTKKFNEISVSLIRDSKGKKSGFSGVSRDITERKRAEDALKKNQEELIKKNQEIEESRKNLQITLERLGVAYEELKTTQVKIIQQEKMASIGQLAAGVAHEINNPMAFIASNLGTLDKYIRRLKDFIQAQSEAIKSLKATDAIEKLEKKRKELKLDYTINDIDLLVKESRDGSERVQKIVRELNRFSRVDDAEYKDANINECMENSINIVGNELQQKATLHKDYGNIPTTKCYPQKLNQVFINLLINAIQAIEKKGKIKIKTWEKGGSIWVTVSDTGCGIPRENQSKIFEPFFTTKEVGKGTGLGLSISYEIMQRHKGEISFESKEGKGTTFTIRMPIV